MAIATAWIWVPALLAAAALLSPAAISMLLLFASGAGLAIRASAPSLALFLRLKPLSIGLAAAGAFFVLTGSLPTEVTWWLVEIAKGYVLSLVHAKQLLAAYSNRCRSHEWRVWCEQAHWAIAGFGAPLALAARSSLHPLLCLALLECAHASAAVLTHTVGPLRRLTVCRLGASQDGVLERTRVWVREGATVGEVASLTEEQWRRALSPSSRNQLSCEHAGFPSGAWRVQLYWPAGGAIPHERALRDVEAALPQGRIARLWQDPDSLHDLPDTGLVAKAVPLEVNLQDEDEHEASSLTTKVPE